MAAIRPGRPLGPRWFPRSPGASAPARRLSNQVLSSAPSALVASTRLDTASTERAMLAKAPEARPPADRKRAPLARVSRLSVETGLFFDRPLRVRKGLEPLVRDPLAAFHR